jgi:hypothetical protein
VKADYITIDEVPEPIVDIDISYMDTPKGYRAFGLNGINKLAVLMLEGLAVIGNTVEEVVFDWNSEVMEPEVEGEQGVVEEKGTDAMLHPLKSLSSESWEMSLRPSEPPLSRRIQCGCRSVWQPC